MTSSSQWRQAASRSAGEKGARSKAVASVAPTQAGPYRAHQIATSPRRSILAQDGEQSVAAERLGPRDCHELGAGGDSAQG